MAALFPGGAKMKSDIFNFINPPKFFSHKIIFLDLQSPVLKNKNMN